MLLHILWQIAALGAVAIAASTPSIELVYQCPTSCKCIDSTAVCSKIDVGKFGTKVSTLKIINPETALRLKSDFLRKIGLESISTLIIENAVIEEIDRNAFRNASVVQKIKISNSHIPDLDPDTFSDCVNLRTLSFSGSVIGNFEYLKSESVEEFHLTNCSLKRISNKHIDNLSELTYLNLAHNFITEINASTFSNAVNLEELNLAHNHITEIPANLFENNSELSTLTLSYNPLTKFTLNIISDIDKLVMKSCKLTEFSSSLGVNLDLLEYLDLSGNHITYLAPDSFANLGVLQYLDLSDNSLASLHPYTFITNTKLEKLILDNNPLDSLPVFASVGNFEVYHFSCHNCHLKSIEDAAFVNMPAIVTLRLSDNSISSFKAIKSLHGLEELDLSNNLIESLDDTSFSENRALKSLKLSGNPLRELDSSIFAKNQVLKKLDVSSCGLSNIWTDNKPSLYSLLQLNVSNNLIRTISQDDLNVTPKIVVMEVMGNPLTCDDSFCDFIRWINDHEVMRPSASYDTHDEIRDAAEFETDNLLTWKDIINVSCGGINACFNNDDYYDIEDSSEDYLENKDNNEILLEKDIAENILNDPEVEIREYKILEKPRFIFSETYILPALVFVITATFVLVIVAVALLAVLKWRRAVRMPREGLPQIKIIPWSNTTKLKKHSGSVYQPLSEEKYGPPTPMINRYEKIPNEPMVHKSMP